MNKLYRLRKLILFSVVLLNSTFVLAKDMDAKQHLKIKLAKLATYEAHFTQTVVDIENTLLQQAMGRIVLQQPNKLYWELFEPNESVLLADGENTKPTYHEKIMIARTKQIDALSISDQISNLCTASSKSQNLEIVALIKEIVPEYISNNSKYEVLDAKK